jgi:hypothetical protein
MQKSKGKWQKGKRGLFSKVFPPVLIFAFCHLPLAIPLCLAAPWSGILDPSRAIDWSQAGIPGGIPSASWPIAATLSPSGGADDSVAIQNAIDAAPAGSVVVLNPGTYTLDRASYVCYGRSDTGLFWESGLCLDKSVVLRGGGTKPGDTVLNYPDGHNIISMGHDASDMSFVSVTSGSTKGSTQIVLSSVSGITAGTYLGITQTNPLDTDGNPLVNIGDCTWCGYNHPNQVMQQLDRVTAVDTGANTVTLERPLYYSYTNSPQVWIITMVENVGLENLEVHSSSGNAAGAFSNVDLKGCAHCWVHDVESDYTVDRCHIYLWDVYGSEISNNYVHESYTNESGENYSIMIDYTGSENLIQNNIVRHARHSLLNIGGSGNVWAYNYTIDSYMSEQTNWLADRPSHGTHPYMELFEGNVVPNMENDFIHGSNSHFTYFRNYINLTAINPGTGTPMTNGLWGVNMEYYSNYDSILGNAIGPYGSACNATSYQIEANDTQVPSIYKIGYPDDGATPTPNQALTDKVEQTMLRGGNWDCVTNTVVWNNNVPTGSLASTYLAQQALPASFYQTAKPSWFGSVPWPPIDPAASVKVNEIPAQLCYGNTVAQGLAFNPNACYGIGGAQPPPPSGNGVAPLSPRAYPNPWRSDRGYAPQITFDQLTGNTTIKIFTVSGHLVRSLSTSNTSTIWDLNNDSGDRVASGIYIYLVTNDQGQKARGKVVVIR